MSTQPLIHRIATWWQPIDRLLDGLKPAVREAFLLSQLDGMTYKLIGRDLGVSEVTVTRYIAKAFHHCTLYGLQADS